MAKLDELMALIEQQQAQINALVGLVDSKTATTTTAASSTPKNGTNNGQKADRTPASELSGTVKKVAMHGKGLVLEGHDRWYNVVQGGKPIFLQVQAGQNIRLELNAANRVVKAYIVTNTTGSRKAAPDGSKVSKAGEVRPPCEFCGGPAHNKYTVEQVRDECVVRQYVKATGNPAPSMVAPETMADFGTWIKNNNVKAFAFSKDGFIQVSLGAARKAASAPTPPSATATASKAVEAAKAAGPKAASRTTNSVRQVASTASTPVAGGASDAGTSTATPSTASPAPAPTPAASTPTAAFEMGKVYQGYLARHAKNTPGLFKFVCAVVPGGKGDGTWLQASEKLTPAIVKLNANDRIAIEIGGIRSESGAMVAGAVRAKLLGSAAAETGVTPGVKTSGKQQPAEPKRQATDSKVKAARTAARTARGEARRDAQEARSKSGNTNAGSLVA